MAVAEKDKGIQCMVRWGDFSGDPPDKDILSVVVKAYHQVYTMYRWNLDSKQNWICRSVGFCKQVVGYSCGFYVLAAIRKLCSKHSKLDCYTFYVYQDK